MEGWKSSYWFEEGEKSIVLKYLRQPIELQHFQVKRTLHFFYYNSNCITKVF